MQEHTEILSMLHPAKTVYLILITKSSDCSLFLTTNSAHFFLFQQLLFAVSFSQPNKEIL